MQFKINIEGEANTESEIDDALTIIETVLPYMFHNVFIASEREVQNNG